MNGMMRATEFSDTKGHRRVFDRPNQYYVTNVPQNEFLIDLENT